MVLIASLLPAHPGWGSVALVLAALSQAAPGWVPVPLLAAALPGIDRPVTTGLFSALLIAVVLTAGLLAAAAAVRSPAG